MQTDEEEHVCTSFMSPQWKQVSHTLEQTFVHPTPHLPPSRRTKRGAVGGRTD